MTLFDENTETERVWLSQSQILSENKSLFEEGNQDKFDVKFSTGITQPVKIRIGYDNSGVSASWHLEKVQKILF